MIKTGEYDLIIAGKESGLQWRYGSWNDCKSLGYNFLNSCVELSVDGNSVLKQHETMEKEIVSTSLPLIIGGQKDWLREKDLRIP